MKASVLCRMSLSKETNLIDSSFHKLHVRAQLWNPTEKNAWQVWMAHCKPKDTKVAIKLTDLEKFQGNTALVRNHGTYLSDTGHTFQLSPFVQGPFRCA